MTDMNSTPVAERVHIGFFGCRNAGKSSVINAVTGQDLSIVSPVKGTTTDPVYKTMELLPAGPVVIIDTPGLDDEGELGEQRVAKGYEVLRKTDVAVIVVDATLGRSAADDALIQRLEEAGVPYLIAWNKSDLEAALPAGERCVAVSALTGAGIPELKERIAALAKGEESEQRIVADLVLPRSFVVLVVPIDKAAPKGRLILPEQQTIRDLLDGGCMPVVCRDSELAETLEKLPGLVQLVVTDSQVFHSVAAIVPDSIPLTSFSILFARYKGNLATFIRGAKALDTLKDGDHILVAEACTHHRQCEDIGTIKLPRLIRSYSGKELVFEFCSGRTFPQDLSRFHLIAHCGGCMLNAREMQYRSAHAEEAEIAVSNYGIMIAYMQGILERSLRPFPGLHGLLEE